MLVRQCGNCGGPMHKCPAQDRRTPDRSLGICIGALCGRWWVIFYSGIGFTRDRVFGRLGLIEMSIKSAMADWSCAGCKRLYDRVCGTLQVLDTPGGEDVQKGAPPNQSLLKDINSTSLCWIRSVNRPLRLFCAYLTVRQKSIKSNKSRHQKRRAQPLGQQANHVLRTSPCLASACLARLLSRGSGWLRFPGLTKRRFFTKGFQPNEDNGSGREE